jgi:hypothetical protein
VNIQPFSLNPVPKFRGDIKLQNCCKYLTEIHNGLRSKLRFTLLCVHFKHVFWIVVLDTFLLVVTGSIMAARADPRPQLNVLLASDNTPTVSWATKGSTMTMSPPAYLLHTLAALRHAKPFSLTPCFTPGDTNQIADCCSCLFALSDTV